MSIRSRAALALSFAVFATVCATGARSALAQDVTILNASYDPTRELYHDYNEAFAELLEAKDRTHDQHPAVQWRVRRTGARRHRRARGRRGDARSRLRHRRDRATRRTCCPRTGSRACPTTARPTPRPSCSWCAREIPSGIQGLARCREAGRIGRHAESEDLGRRALELSGRLRLCARKRRAAATRRRGTSSRRLYHNVPVLDSGARGSTITFSQRGVGDVLLGVGKRSATWC